MITKIVVTVEGGLIQNIFSNNNIEVYVIDYDNLDTMHESFVYYVPANIFETIDDLFVGKLNKEEKLAKKKLIKLMNK